MSSNTEKVAGTQEVPGDHEIKDLEVICAKQVTHRGF